MTNELYVKLGKVLQLERQRQHIELTDLSELLKIPVSNLESIEEGDAGALPSELYFNLFAKSYAEYLRIDYGRTVEAIREDITESTAEAESKSDKPALAGARPETDSGGSGPGKDEVPAAGQLAKRVLMLTVGIIALLLVFLGGYTLLVDRPLLPGDKGPPSEHVSAVSRAVGESGEPALDFGDFDWNVPHYKRPPDLVLTLVAHQECWAGILADGDTAVFRNLIPWKEYVVAAKYRLVISVGVPSQVRITLNGREVDITDEESGRIYEVEINQANLVTFLNRPRRQATTKSTAAVNEMEPDTSQDSSLSESSLGETPVDSI